MYYRIFNGTEDIRTLSAIDGSLEHPIAYTAWSTKI